MIVCVLGNPQHRNPVLQLIFVACFLLLFIKFVRFLVIKARNLMN